MKVVITFLTTVALAGSGDAACPHSALWMKYGPKRAAEILQEKHGRNDINMNEIARNPRHGKMFKTLNTDAPNVGYGTCEYENPFSGTNDCVQLTGEGWNKETAGAMCANAMMGMAKGTLTKGKTCAVTPMLAGYCYTKDGTSMAEAMPMSVNPSMSMMANCKAVASACTMWSPGRFAYTGACNKDGSDKTAAEIAAMVEAAGPTSPENPEPSKTKPACSLAPGPMGAAHQHAWSPGYKVGCKDAPGANSPYQWPIRYTSKFNSTTMPVASTGRRAYRSYGQVWYDFEKNWKRVDTVTQPGGSLPFVTSDMVGSDSSTVLHRGSEMVFINYWANGTKTCSKMDLGVIGNIRPDWFMDNRGAATSTQFLGNQHIFHRGEPTLVKQWRKKDFADMFFVMSMSAEADENGYHWPLQRNDPGEGFGDDALHSFFEHAPLEDNEKDNNIFLIDQELNCPTRPSSDQDGPPAMDEEEPSHLNVDEAGWFEFEYTLSPDGPESAAEAQAEMEGGDESSEVAVVATGAMGGAVYDLLGVGTLEVCMENTDTLKAMASFKSSEEVWAGLGIRPADSPSFCAMTPANVIIGEFEGDKTSVKSGPLLAGLHKFEASASDLEKQYSKMESSTDAEVSFEDSSVVLSVTTLLDESYNGGKRVPITWAIGKSPQLQYHTTRGCLELKNIPACGSVVAAPSSGTGISKEIAADITKAAQCTENLTSVMSKLDKIQSSLDQMKPKPVVCENLRGMKACKKHFGSCRWSMASKCTSVAH